MIYIYISLYKYLKGKKKHKPITEKKKKKKTIVTAQNLEKKKVAHETKLRSYSALAHSCTSLIVKIL